jgi:serine/threonine-protein kinase RsbW
VTEPGTLLRIENSITEIERASAWLDRFATTADVPDTVTAKLQVAMDEVLSNIIRHGLPERTCGARTIRLGLRIVSGLIELTVADDGLAFDLTRAARAPASVSINQRRCGGAGLLFVQSLMDEIRYSRLNGCNRLVLCKRLPGPAG